MNPLECVRCSFACVVPRGSAPYSAASVIDQGRNLIGDFMRGCHRSSLTIEGVKARMASIAAGSVVPPRSGRIRASLDCPDDARCRQSGVLWRYLTGFDCRTNCGGQAIAERFAKHETLFVDEWVPPVPPAGHRREPVRAWHVSAKVRTDADTAERWLPSRLRALSPASRAADTSRLQTDVEHFGEQFALAGEVSIQRPGANAGVLGHRGDGTSRIAVSCHCRRARPRAVVARWASKSFLYCRSAAIGHVKK